MYKLVLSPRRYSAVIGASCILENSVVIIVADGMEEQTPYRFCRDALRVQREFEIEKAYKVFGVRQLFMMRQNWFDIDYELLAVKLQLMLSTQPFTHLYYSHDEDQRLLTICRALQGGAQKLRYTNSPRRMWEIKPGATTFGKKMDAVEKFITIRKELLYNHKMNREFIERVTEDG
jgi:hypothetical protein